MHANSYWRTHAEQSVQPWEWESSGASCIERETRKLDPTDQYVKWALSETDTAGHIDVLSNGSCWHADSWIIWAKESQLRSMKSGRMPPIPVSEAVRLHPRRVIWCHTLLLRMIRLVSLVDGLQGIL